MLHKAFSPTGKTFVVAGATTAPLGIQPTESGTNGGYQYRIHNAGTVTAYLAFDSTAAGAQTKAVIPAAGVPQDAIALPAGIVEVLSFPIGSYFSAITASGTANIFLVIGKGI
jgi:hypothetical protein